MLRYSDIIGQAFLNIKLSQDQIILVDAHFLAASHHFWRFKASESPFHKDRMFAHIKNLMNTVLSGDFSEAVDTSGSNLHRESAWVFRGEIPDEGMFDYMHADIRFQNGEDHPYDVVLDLPIEARQIYSIRFDLVQA